MLAQIPILGISHPETSLTLRPKFGAVVKLPLVGSISEPLSSIIVGREAPDQGSVAYYEAQTNDKVVVELATAAREGMYQYTFPASSGENDIVIVVSNVLPSFRGRVLGPVDAGGQFTIMPDRHHEASGIYNNEWNRRQIGQSTPVSFSIPHHQS
jgi:Glycosyl hydrolase family 92 N-terminal domain